MDVVVLFQIICKFRVYFSFPSKGKGDGLLYCLTVPLQYHQNSPISESNSTKALIPCDALSTTSRDSNMSLKMKTVEE